MVNASKYMKYLAIKADKKLVSYAETIITSEPVEVVESENYYRHFSAEQGYKNNYIGEDYAIIDKFVVNDEVWFTLYCEENGIDINAVEKEMNKAFLEEFLKSYIGNKKRELEVSIENTRRDIISMRNSLFRANERLMELKCEMHGNILKDEVVDKMRSEIELIRNHKKVIDIGFEPVGDAIYNFYIDVKDLILTEPEREKRYKIADTRIHVDFNENYIYFKPIDEEDEFLSYGYWTEAQLHPHIDEYGEPCAGNAAAQFADYFAQREYYALFITALNFLQTCNIDDSAGEMVGNWYLVDENGNPTYRPNDEKEKCCECGRVLEDGAEHCRECGEPLCEECGHEHISGEVICENCYNHSYWECNHCGHAFLRWEGSEDNDGYWYCDNCIDEGYGNFHEEEDPDEGREDNLLNEPF